MKSRYIKAASLCAIGLFISANAMAEHLTAEQALARYQKTSGIRKLPSRNGVTPTLTFSNEGGYVFTQNEEFVMLPANDELPAVIGYGDNAVGEIPPAMKWLLSTAATAQMADVTEHSEIKPLIQTKWNQRAPFNNMCPEESGQRCVTGCVATATAQVVNYHKCPAVHGSGTHSYEWNGQTLSFDYENTTFDWANMLNEYKSGAYNDAQASAVATLMSAMGVGLDMGYSPEGSGTFSMLIPEMLYSHMGFDKGVAYMDREYFSADDWDSIIYGELAESRPVIYSGQATGGGHTFICDGYSSEGNYHINWGWGGSYDGYFPLTALNPEGQGTGGFEGGYNSQQDAIIGIRPAQEGSQLFLPLYTLGNFAFFDNHFGFLIDDRAQAVVNFSATDYSFYTGIKLIDENEEVTYLTDQLVSTQGATAADGKIGNWDFFAFINIQIPTTLPAGTYTVYPVVKPEDGTEWQDIIIADGQAKSMTMRVGNNGVITYDGSDPDDVTSPFVMTKFTQTQDFVNGKSGGFTSSFKNNSNEAAHLDFIFKMENPDTHQLYDFSQYWFFDFNASQAVNFSEITYTDFPMPDGKYTLYCYDYGRGVKISDGYTVYVGVRPTEIQLSHTDVTLTHGVDNHQFTATVLPEEAFDRTVTWHTDNPEVATIDPDGKITTVGEGNTTVTATSVNGLTATASLAVKKADTSYLQTIEAEQELRCYDLQGRPVSNPTRGLYIINGKKTIHHSL